MPSEECTLCVEGCRQTSEGPGMGVVGLGRMPVGLTCPRRVGKGKREFSSPGVSLQLSGICCSKWR